MNSIALPVDVSDARSTRDVRNDRAFAWIVGAAGVFVLVALISAAFSMFWGGRLAFQTFGLKFLWTDAWDPVNQVFGALVPIYGTLVTAFVAMLIAVPVSFGIAMFLRTRSAGHLKFEHTRSCRCTERSINAYPVAISGKSTFR